MSDQGGTLEEIGRHLALAVQPLADAVSDKERFRAFLYQLGWNATDVPAQYSLLGDAVTDALAKLDALSDPPELLEITALIDAVREVFTRISGISVAPPGVDPGPFLAEIGERLFENLLTSYVAAALPATNAALQALDVIHLDPIPAAGNRPSFVRVRLDWAAIPKVITEPATIPERVYGWGTAALDLEVIMDHLSSLFFALGFPVRTTPPEDDLIRGLAADALAAGAPVTSPSLIVPFFYIEALGQPLEAAFVVHGVPATDGKLPGIAIEPRLPDQFPLNVPLADTMALRITAGTNAPSTVGVVIRPGEIAIRYPFQPGTTPPSAGLGVGFDFNPATPTLLVGSPGSTRLEFKGASVDAAVKSVDGQFDASVGVQLKGLTLVLTAGDGDSFIQSILGSGESRVEMTLGVEVSKRHGVRFTGSGAFEVSVHPHLRLGPIEIVEVTIRLLRPPAQPPDLQLELGAGIAGQLGPLTFMVQGIGMRVEATFSPGNLGPLDLELGFKPPNGVGLSIDGGGFSGGGFLIFDEPKGEYSGGLELEFQGFISLKAIGILNTKMPGGREGFSLLIIITAEFPPIQLGFGFTLLGVGGLLGLNRTVMFEALRAGVRDGSLESVLFPRDIVANAVRIVSDLGRIFPPLEDRFLIGPMAKLGWGTPTIISLEIGIILEIPRPAFAILGIVRIALPAEELPLLNLQVNFLGIVDFDKGQLSFDASLFDSRLLTFTLTGDMALRIYWGPDANFLLTVGGFHPAYTPPPMGLPDLRRLGIVIFQGNPNLRAEAYFAVTSNTVQFGAKVELYAGASVFNVYGFLALDVLIQFNPFKFVAQVGAMLAVRTGSSTLFSVSLELTLEGPEPWHAIGKASFKIGFIIKITISVHFDVTIGSERRTTLPAVEVMPKLLEALGHPGNWRAISPSASGQHVSLQAQPPESKVLVLHPFGTLEVTQKVVPLNLDINRFGAQRPQNGSNFRIASVQLGTVTPPHDTTKEQFAPAQFIDMTDAQKLSRKSFEKFDAGVRVGGGDNVNTDYVTGEDVVYEVVYLPIRHKKKLYRIAEGLFSVLRRGSAVAKSPLSTNKYAPSPLATPPVKVNGEKFAVASTKDLSLHGSSMVFDSEAEAYQALGKLESDDMGLSSELQVVPLYEVAGL
jgi:hypothetical protein